MWFEKKVGRKEFDAMVNALNNRIRNAENIIDEQAKYWDGKFAKLEAANNCRDGKHEWETAGEIKNLGNGVFTNVAFTSCKHCTIKKDEWEKNKPTSDLAQAIAGGHGYGRPYVKPQPKRNKGKK